MAIPYYDRDRRYRNPGGDDNFNATPTAGTMNHAYSSHNNANEYMASGTPFVYTSAQIDCDGQSAEKTIYFPMVTRWVMVNIYSASNPATLVNTAQVGFSLAGDGTTGSTDSCAVSAYLCARQRLEIKCNQICIHIPNVGLTTVQIEVIAGLTNVPSDTFPDQDALFVAGVTDNDKDGSTGAPGSPVGTSYTLIS